MTKLKNKKGSLSTFDIEEAMSSIDIHDSLIFSENIRSSSCYGSLANRVSKISEICDEILQSKFKFKYSFFNDKNEKFDLFFSFFDRDKNIEHLSLFFTINPKYTNLVEKNPDLFIESFSLCCLKALSETDKENIEIQIYKKSFKKSFLKKFQNRLNFVKSEKNKKIRQKFYINKEDLNVFCKQKYNI